MSELKLVAHRVHPDEPAWDMFCGPIGGRFVTRVRVVRADTLAEHDIDHGPEEAFARIPPLYMPSMLEENVGTLLEYGERHRHDLRWWNRAQEMKAESTLIADAIRQEEARLLQLQNRSVSGPYQRSERGAYSRTAARRRFQDRRREAR